jgi:hypothetical protein
MADPYRISPASESAGPTQHPGTRAGLLRPALWLALIDSAATNAVSSSIGTQAFVGIGFGLITVACAATLIVHHYRHRRAAAATLD